jgi:hypothetical protein
MKIIDKTPLQNDKGEIGLIERIQGTLKYGASWYSELEAQKVIIGQIDRALEKGFVLIRNFTLPDIEVVIPLILVGPPGIYCIHVTHLAGFYEAKGDQWNIADSGHSKPASPNLILKISRLARALQTYIEKQGIKLSDQVWPVLIASNPAMHIDSMRPLARTVQSDGVNAWAASLLQARPVMQTEAVHDLADRIINPRPKAAPQPEPQTPPPASQVPVVEAPAASRAQAIFRASEETPPLNPNDLDFAFEDSPAEVAAPQKAVPSQNRPRLVKPAQRGMKAWQWVFLAVVLILELCIVAGFGYLILIANR